MRVDHYFSVPLVVHDIEPAVRDTIRDKVLAYLDSASAQRDVALSPEESVSTSYYRPEASIIEDADLKELEAAVIGAARDYLEKTLQLPPRPLEIERAWINIFEPGAQEAQHTHDGSLLSCSYYVEAPENCGCIVFPDPISARRSYREFTQTTTSGLLTRAELAVEPQPGRFVMFESWTPHSVQCNKSDKIRISIAINMRYAAETATATSSPHSGEAPSLERPVDKAGAGAPAPAPHPADAKTRPFLFNELFDVKSSIGLDLQPVAEKIPAVVIDNFLEHPERVREVIGSTPAVNWKHEEGGRNFMDYYDCRLRFPIRYPNKLVALAQQTIAQVYAEKTTPADPSVDVNWFMQINEKRGNFAVPHNDMTESVRRSFTCIVYLNSPQECSGGTAFFRFKKSNSLVFDEAYVHAVEEDTGLGESGLDYWPEGSADKWEQVGVIEMVPGRMLIFPSEHFHAAYHPQNSFYEFPRLTLAFWMVC